MDLIIIYQKVIFYVLYLLLFSIIILLIINFRKIISQFNKISKKTWIRLSLIFIIGFILRIFIFPHFHIMYIDEPWYLEMAKNFNQKQEPVICEYVDFNIEKCFLPFKPPAWPFLISIVQIFFGLSSYVPIYFNSILGSLTVCLIFFVSYVFFRNENVALWSALLLSLTPLHILWSNSAETNNVSVFFVLLAILLFLYSLKVRSLFSYLLLVIMLFFTFLIRFENLILFPVFILGYLLYISKNSNNKFLQLFDAIYPLIIIIMLSLMIFFESIFIKFLRLYIVSFDSYFLNVLPFIKSIGVVILMLGLLNLIFFRKKDNFSINFLFLIFIFYFLFYLPLFTELEQRMVLIPLIILILLLPNIIEYVFLQLKKYSNFFIIIMVILFFILFYFQLTQGYENTFNKYDIQMFETQTVIKIKQTIPANSVIITYYPTVIHSVSNMKSFSTIFALNNLKIINQIKINHSVYFFYDGFCTNKKIAYSPNSAEYCNELLNNFKFTVVKQFNYTDTEFFLYEMR